MMVHIVCSFHITCSRVFLDCNCTAGNVALSPCNTSNFLLLTSHRAHPPYAEIGRIIGQRWRSIEEDDLAKYKEMAKQDSERYRDEMKTFYQDELTLMCLGHNDGPVGQQQQGQTNNIPNGHHVQGDVRVGMSSQGMDAMDASPFMGGDANKKMAELQQFNESKQLMEMLQQQQMIATAQEQRMQQAVQQAAAMGMGMGGMFPNLMQQASNPIAMFGNPAAAPLGMGMMNTMPGMMHPNVAPSQAAASSSNNIMTDEQLSQLLMFQQAQQQASNDDGQGPNKELINQILAQKAAIQQQQVKLNNETKTLRLKDALLDKMLAKEQGSRDGCNEVNADDNSNGGEKTNDEASGLDDNLEQMSTEQIMQLLKASHAPQAPSQASSNQGGMGDREAAFAAQLRANFGGMPGQSPSMSGFPGNVGNPPSPASLEQLLRSQQHQQHMQPSLMNLMAQHQQQQSRGSAASSNDMMMMNLLGGGGGNATNSGVAGMQRSGSRDNFGGISAEDMLMMRSFMNQNQHK